MATIASELLDYELWIKISGHCEPGSDGNYIGQLIDFEIKKYRLSQIQTFVYDLREADYVFGDYLGQPFQLLSLEHIHLEVLTNQQNDPCVRSLCALIDADTVDIFQSQV